MAKDDFVKGSSKVEDFWKFINDRHTIYLKRKQGLPKPWSDDPIFQQWKFTNVFRELDRGTIAIRKVLKQLWWDYERHRIRIPDGHRDVNYNGTLNQSYIRYQFINCILYRMFNHHPHTRFGPIANPTAFYKYLEQEQSIDNQIFGGAYMHAPGKTSNKLQDYVEVCREIVSDTNDHIEDMQEHNSLERAWRNLQEYDCVGPFVAYEFVCDLRYTDILRSATDVCSWCNIGPGAVRGLQRMGMKPDLKTILGLYRQSPYQLSLMEGKTDFSHWIYSNCAMEDGVHTFVHNKDGSKVRTEVFDKILVYPYWELREVEHCLCEFDKYERIRLGQGRPRSKFSGLPSE